MIEIPHDLKWASGCDVKKDGVGHTTYDIVGLKALDMQIAEIRIELDKMKIAMTKIEDELFPKIRTIDSDWEVSKID